MMLTVSRFRSVSVEVMTRAITVAQLVILIQGLAIGEADPDSRYGLRVAESACQQFPTTRLALIEDDHCRVAGRRRIVTLSSKVQVPRWMSAIEWPPALRGSRLASQPEAAAGFGGWRDHDVIVGTSGPVMSPLPE